MESNERSKHLRITEYLRRFMLILLCLTMVSSVFTNFTVFSAKALGSSVVRSDAQETREETKARLMKLIKSGKFDPYSADMTVEEFFALMELFDEGKLPLNQVSTYSLLNTLAANEDSYIPREKFLFGGLANYVRNSASDDNDSPLEYDNTNGASDELDKYPAGLDPYGSNYMRPPKTWDGVPVTEKSVNRVVLVSEGVNDNNVAVAGDVIQNLFAKYTGYYVKQVTIDGANINVLGVIDLGNRYIYYYLSAEEQNTQVSTTTLPDDAKFIIEYVPVEHTVDYVVKMDGSDEPITDQKPENVVFYGSNTPTTLSWVDSIFSTSRPNRTTDGAYAFDVFVPYGYELRILISIDMTVDIPYSRQTTNNSFHVDIDHTSKKEAVKAAWLKAYSDYLNKEGFIEDDIKNHITETTDADGKITLKWKDADIDKPAHDSILARMAERINDFVTHNNGYPLGTYPDYTERGEGGFKILPDPSKSPTEHTMNDTFYNHLVKADRTITAVLKKQDNPTFDVSQILQKSDGAINRGSSATEDFAFASLEHYDEDYKYHIENGPTQNRDGDPLTHSAAYPNIQSEKNAWEWGGENDSFRGKPQKMKYDAETGTYSYTWFFQTNSREGGYYLDAFEVNGIPISVPFYPKYNWGNSYIFQGETEIADKKHPYYTETTLADGSILKLEFLLGWNSNPPQRHYRVTVTGARSNVVVTGLNLMTGTGAPEFVTYNLVGVYSDEGGYSQTAPAIEYYAQTGGWTRKAQANVVVDSNNLGIDYNGGDTGKYGANIRFKIADGYGNPYYSWTNRHGDVINGQASVTLDDEWNVTSTNEIRSIKDVGEGEELSSQYIYDGGDGYYYIRVTNQDNNTPGKDKYRFALLTVVARTIKYTVRYVPEYTDTNEIWNGFVIDPNSGEPVKLTNDFDPNNILDLDLDSMPSYNHDPEVCALYGMAKDETGTVPEKYSSILHQYDDNEGPFYDLIFNTMATIANNTYGTISPKDKNKNYIFMNWIVVGEDFTPVKDAEGNYIQFRSGAIDFTKYAHYAVKHTAFGSADTDIHVLRLMPVWRPINNPFTYNVVLNWVDNLGNIHADNFNDYWDEVVTEMTVGGQVYVYLNKDAKPLRDWIANHPTYTFWDDVNNATTKDEIEKALKEYIENGGDNDNYDAVLKALSVGTNDDGTVNARAIGADDGEESGLTDVFERLGNDVFLVKQDGGNIGVWMYEDKAGLVFQKVVNGEPFIPDDEFYFTITNARVGENYEKPLNGKYKAYPQFVYDEDGNLRDRTDDDAWLVEFKDGEIVSINGDEKVTYFTLKNGDGISLYVSDGRYTVAELGSKSGSPYKTSVTYASTDGSGPKEGWILPKDRQLVGSEKSVNPSDNVKQVTATVDFEIGEHNVVQTLTFTNSNLSMRINCKVLAPTGNSLLKYDFEYQLQFTLPSGETPLQDDAGNYYYNVTAYRKTVDSKGKIKYVATSGKLRMMSETQIGTRALGNSVSPFDVGNNVWYGALDSSNSAFTLKGDDYYVIALPAPSDSDSTVGYTAIETKPTDSEAWHLDGGAYSRSGELKLGIPAVETYINTVNDPSIYVTKRVVRSDGKKETGSFMFTVTLSDTTYNDANFTNGVATFSLKDGESRFMVLKDIPTDENITYTVTEAPSSEYAANSTNASGTIVDGSMITVSFVNTQIKPGPGYLVITETGGKKGETFLYRITDENGKELIVSVTIGKDGTGKTIVQCPSGYYTVEEITDWAWRYEDGKCKQTMPIYVNNSHTLENPVHADFTNERNSKVWLGGESRNNNLFVFHKKEEEETD